MAGAVATVGDVVSEVRIEHLERSVRLLRIDVDALGGGSGGTSDHGALTGLADDDHPQYALADGTRGTFEVAGAVAAHAAATDPHPAYTTAAELSSAISAHEALPDPHPGYTTAAELAAALSGVGGVPLSQVKRAAWWY